MYEAYAEQIRGLRDGGVDLLLIETIFDTLNAKAAIAAAMDVAPELPLLDLGDDRRPERPDAVRSDDRGVLDLDRARRAADRRASTARSGATRDAARTSRTLARVAPVPVACYPNAGLPNAFGGYDETPEITSALLGEFARDGLVNIVGGCCGTTPGAHPR